MIEAITPRTGTDPVTQTALAPPTAPAGADPISGHERTIGFDDDLQCACIFNLPQPKDCITGSPGCDCNDPTDSATNPICDDANPSLQVRGKAYPGLRELELVKALGSSGVLASICPAEVVNPAAADFGYRPAVRAIADAAAARLPMP